MINYPFLRADFLHALESSQSIGGNSGWTAAHQAIESSQTTAAFMPLYVKTHSWGEYVFDWAWADAYQRHGLNYYPKLITAIPFTPATGPRIRFAAGVDQQTLTQQLIDDTLQLATENQFSSWHILFPEPKQRALFKQDERLMERTGVQFQWNNANYSCFEDFLLQLTSRKRKMIKRERRQIVEQKLTIELRKGPDIDTELWRFFFHLYHQTYLKRSGNSGYLTEDFFHQLGATLPEQVAMAIAWDGNNPVAAALYFYDNDTLYGRYWGCLKEYDFLHFELCYYQGIEFCIQQKLKIFDAGAQGEHKIPRGFRPVFTHSLHWIAEPDFADAIQHFLRDEKQQMIRYKNEAEALLPYKNSGD